jgi:hypothetical protein
MDPDYVHFVNPTYGDLKKFMAECESLGIADEHYVDGLVSLTVITEIPDVLLS